MPFSLQIVYQGRGFKSGEIAMINAADHVYLEHESKKVWKNSGKNENDFNNNFVIIHVLDKEATDKEVWGLLSPYNLLDPSQENMRRYKIDLDSNKQFYKDLKKEGEMFANWADISGDIIDQKAA